TILGLNWRRRPVRRQFLLPTSSPSHSRVLPIRHKECATCQRTPDRKPWPLLRESARVHRKRVVGWRFYLSQWPTPVRRPPLTFPLSSPDGVESAKALPAEDILCETRLTFFQHLTNADDWSQACLQCGLKL